MFDVGFWELTLVAVIAMIVVGPERLPVVARTLGRWVGRARGYAHGLTRELEQEVDVEGIRREVNQARESIESQTRHAVDDIDSHTRDAFEDIEDYAADIEEDELDARRLSQSPDDNDGFASQTTEEDPRPADDPVEHGDSQSLSVEREDTEHGRDRGGQF